LGSLDPLGQSGRTGDAGDPVVRELVKNDWKGDAMNKTLLLTGASSGLGVAVAVQAAQAGYDVYATMRDPGRRAELDAATAAAGVSVTVLPLDVETTSSVQGAVAGVMQRAGRIDVLVANAGVGFARTTEQATEADIDWVMNVNFKGVVRCVQAVLPHMRAARSGRVVAISSVGGLVGQPFNEIYCASKFAVEGYVEALATYVGPAFGLGFTLVEPGGITSAFAKRAMEQITRSGGLIEDEYLPIMHKYLGTRQNRAEGVFQTPAEVAAVVIGCLDVTRPPVRLRTSAWAEDLCRLKTEADPDGTVLQARVVRDFLGGFDAAP
jgi:NAD(P)-dependent dehydrogenase (short-subunit alcohol dehydrogenase family)